MHNISCEIRFEPIVLNALTWYGVFYEHSMTYVNARISKIVVPLDGSESAMEAADYALLIAK